MMFKIVFFIFGAVSGSNISCFEKKKSLLGINRKASCLYSSPNSINFIVAKYFQFQIFDLEVIFLFDK